jgi:hypothetical protein
VTTSEEPYVVVAGTEAPSANEKTQNKTARRAIEMRDNWRNCGYNNGARSTWCNGYTE